MPSFLKLRSLQKHHEEEAKDAEPRLPTTIEMWVITLTSAWFFAGLFLDGWAHNHRPDLESFFTPWHAVFYSGYFATAIALFLIIWLGRRKRGGTFVANIPQGFGHALIGVVFFLIGGVGDLVWHEVFGIESDIEALLSPTHLVLAVSMFLIVSTGLRVWFRTHPPIGVPKLIPQLPMIFSAIFTTSLIWCMTQFSHFVTPRASGLRPDDAAIANMSQNIAVTGYLLHIAIIVGCALFIVRRARIATGGLTLLFTLSMLAMSFMRDNHEFVLSGLIAGCVADVLARSLHPFELHRNEVRIFGFVVPVVFFAAYFGTVIVTRGTWWSVHMWTGSIVMAGLSGLLATFLLLPLREWDE